MATMTRDARPHAERDEHRDSKADGAMIRKPTAGEQDVDDDRARSARRTPTTCAASASTAAPPNQRRAARGCERRYDQQHGADEESRARCRRGRAPGRRSARDVRKATARATARRRPAAAARAEDRVVDFTTRRARRGRRDARRAASLRDADGLHLAPMSASPFAMNSRNRPAAHATPKPRWSGSPCTPCCRTTFLMRGDQLVDDVLRQALGRRDAAPRGRSSSRCRSPA